MSKSTDERKCDQFKEWDDIFAAFHAADVHEDFMAERPMNRIPQDRDIFGEDVKSDE